MEAIFSVLITVGLGSWLAYIWQLRSSKQARYFDASKTRYEQMLSAARDLAKLAGERFYATHRVCRISPSNAFFDEAKEDFRQSILLWNRSHLQTDLNIRTLFTSSYVVSLEALQGELASLTNKVSRRLERVQLGDPPEYQLMRDSENLRGRYFIFLQGMLDEADNLFRQMHFGVMLRYNAQDIKRYSTWHLFKVLVSGDEEESAVLRSPIDFGSPVGSGDARLGIDQH